MTEAPGIEGPVANSVLPPLVIDLDRTLVKADLLFESLLALLRKQPLLLFLVPLWMLRGKAAAKHEIACRVSLDVTCLPWRRELIDYLKDQRAAGRFLVLATGSDMRIARQVADHLKIFDLVLATDGGINLCGKTKRDSLVSRFGEQGFDYAADGAGRRDLEVWAAARKAILVNPAPRVQTRVARVAGIEHVFADRDPKLAAALRALRPAHWLKNLLIFAPVFVAHRFHEVALLEKSILTFVAFGLCASSGYLLNDMFDLEADRHHPKKQFRPFAAGALPLSFALYMIPALAISGCILGALVSPLLAVIVLAYFALSAAYSVYVKKVAVLDVLFLAGLYCVRLMAGSVAVGIWSSHWLLAFSIFLFFSLALVKRYGELIIMRRIHGDGAKARAYELSDAELLAAMGVASGYLAVLVLALYIASGQAESLYAGREFLWLLCPLLLYWISHVWLTAHRGRIENDPLIFAASDRTSQILILLMILTALVVL